MYVEHHAIAGLYSQARILKTESRGVTEMFQIAKNSRTIWRLYGTPKMECYSLSEELCVCGHSV